MSLYITAGNEEFLLNNGLDFCPEIIPAGQEKSKRCDMWLVDQISKNQGKDGISNQIEYLTGCMLETDDNNLVNYGQQTAISVTNILTKFFHAFHTSSKVI